MSYLGNESFDDIVARKQAQLSSAANAKRTLFEDAVYSKQLAITPDRDYQGLQDKLNANASTELSFKHNSLFNKNADADSIMGQNAKGEDVGIRALGLDTWEHSSYKGDKNKIRASQRKHYARLFNVPENEVTVDQIHAMGRRADNRFRNLLTEGQGEYDQSSGTFSNMPGKQFEGFEDQLWAPESFRDNAQYSGEVTYDPLSRKYKTDKRTKVDSFINPNTGVDLYKAMNTPEFNTRWFANTVEQNAIRSAYEAEHGTAYNTFKAPTASRDHEVMGYTQHGRAAFGLNGEVVSEKAITLQMDGKWVNVPTIWKGEKYSDDEVAQMLINNEVSPTSEHSTKQEAIDAAKKRSDEITVTPLPQVFKEKKSKLTNRFTAEELEVMFAKDSYWEVVTKSLSAGVDSIQAAGYGLAALAAEVTKDAKWMRAIVPPFAIWTLIHEYTSDVDFADAMLEEYQTKIQEAHENGAQLPAWDAENMDWTNPDMVFRQILAGVGEFIPSIVGGGIAGKIVSTGVKSFLKHKMKKWGADKAVKRKALLAGEITGATVGSNAFYMGIGGGSVYGDLGSAGYRGRDAQVAAIGGGIVIGALDSIVPRSIAKQLGLSKSAVQRFKGELKKKGFVNSAGKVLTETAKGGLGEGVTETLQQVVENSVINMVKHGELPPFTSDEAFSEYVGVFIKTVLGGGAIKGTITTGTEAVSLYKGDKGAIREAAEQIAAEAEDARNEESGEHSVEAEAELKLLVKEFSALNLDIDGLPENFDSMNNLNKVIHISNALQKADNQEIINNSGRSTQEIESIQESLNNVVNALQNSSDTNSVAAVEAAFDAAIKNDPARKDYYLQQKEQQLATIKELSKLKKNKDKKKAISPALQKLIDDAITVSVVVEKENSENTAKDSTDKDATDKDATSEDDKVEQYSHEQRLINLNEAFDAAVEANPKEEAHINKLRALEVANLEGQTILNQEIARIGSTGLKGDTTGKGNSEFVGRLNKAVSSFKTGGVDSQLQTEQYGAALHVKGEKDKLNRKVEKTTDSNPSNREANEAAVVGEKEKILKKEKEASKSAEETQEKADEKSTEVVSGHVEKIIKQINALTKKIEDSGINPKHKKRLENKRNNLGLLIDTVASQKRTEKSVNEVTNIAIQDTLDSFDYQHVIVDIENLSITKSSDRDAIVKSALDAIEVLRDKDVEYAEKIRIIAGVLAARERLVQNLISIKKQLKRVTEESQVKDLETELNRTNDSIKKMEPFVKEISGMKFEQVNNTKNKFSDLLYSLKTESFKNIDRDALDDSDKPLYDLVAKMVAKQARRDKAVGNKDIGQVNREILYGDEGYQGYEGYKQDAKDGTISIKNLTNFVKGLQAKLVAFNKAVAKSKKLNQDVWVNKETLEIITERPLPEGQKTATLTKDGYKDFDRENFWFINAKNSNKLINLLKLEVELGVATLKALTKYKDSTKNKVVITEEIEEHNKLIAQINKLVNPPEDTGDLNNLGKGETVKEALQPFVDAVNKATKKLNYESKQVVKYIKKLKANDKEVFETVYLKELKAKIALIEANINLWEAKEVVGKVTSTQASKAIIKLNSDIVSITAEIDKAVKDAKARKDDKRTLTAKQHFLNAQERLKGSFIKIVSKAKDSIFVNDIFGVKDDTRLSLAVYAQDEDNGDLTAESIKSGLIDLGITDKKYIRYIVKTFEQFKATYTDNIVADVDGIQSEKYNKVGVFNYSEPLGMLYVKDGKSVKLPDTVLFAMMMGSLEWLSISQGESAFMDSQAIAQYLKGDRKAHVTPEEISIFGNMGITYGNGSRSLGPIVYNYLNMRSLGANSKLKFSELMKDPTSIMKDSSIEERLIVALGEMSLEILEQMPATVTKARTTNFISITRTEFPSEHFGVNPLVSWRETVKGISPRDIVKIPAVLRKAEKAVDTAFLKLSKEKQTWENYISLWEKYFNPTKGSKEFIAARKKELAVLRADAEKRNSKGLSNIFINETEDNLSLARVASSLINGYTLRNTIKLLPEDHKAFENIIKFIKEGKDNVKTTMGTQTILDDILDEPSTEIQERATGSPHLLPKFVRNLIEKLQNVEWRGKKGELGLFKLLNIKNRRLLAKMNDDVNPHIEHVDGIEASNAIKEKELAAVDEYIALEGSEDGEHKPFYFRFKAQVQHRLRIVSNTINGQASKIHRALFLPIKAISTISLDTAKKQSISRIVFKIAVAQAFGYSVDKKPLTEILDAFDKYVEISKDLVEAVSRGDITEKEFNAKLTAFIKDNKDNDVAPSMHILEAIIALTEYDPDGVFDTRIGLEIDGITNGYAISLLQFLSLSEKELKSFKEIYGENTPEFKAAIVDELVSSLKRVGINVDKSETYDMFLQAGDLDVYQVLSMRIVESFNDPEYIEKINKDNKIKLKQEQLDALEGVQGTLFDKATQKLEKLARDLAKAPVMTSVYGASIFKIINNIAADITDNVYTDFADFQRRYNATKEGSAEQSTILNEVADYSNNLAALLNFKQVGVVKKAVKGKRAKKQKAISIIKALKAGELEQHVLPRKTIETLEFTVVRIYTPAMTSTMDKLIGGLRESSSVVVKANEYQFMLFRRKLEQAKEYYLKTNNLPPESKVPQDVIEVLVKRLAMEYLPSYYGPKSSSTPIPLIKRGKEDDNAVTIKFKSKRVTKKKKLGKRTTRQDSKTPKIGSRATPGSSNTFERMGVGAALGQIINIDSAVLGEVLEVFPNALPIFDAYFGTVNDMVSVSKTYGSSFGRIGNTHSILAGTLKRLHKYVQDDSKTVTIDDAIDIDAPYLKLTQEDIDKTNEEYAESSFEANELRKQLEKATGNSNEEARITIQLSELGISQIIGELNTRIDTVKAHKNLLKNAGYSLEDANVEQMPISSLKNKTQKPKTKTSSNDTNKNSDIPNIQGELPGFETAEGKPTKLSKTLKKSELQKLAKARDIDTSNMTVADLRTAIKRFDAGKKVFPKLVEPKAPSLESIQPVLRMFMGRIHPESAIASDFRRIGITSKTVPGFYSKNIKLQSGIDGIPMSEMQADLLPLGISPVDEQGGSNPDLYVDIDWIMEQIEEEFFNRVFDGDNEFLNQQYNQEFQDYQQELAQQQAELEAEEDAAANTQGDFIGLPEATNDKDIIKNIEAKIQEEDFTEILTCNGASCTINSKIITGILDDLGISSFVVYVSFMQDTTDGGTKWGDHIYTIANINNRLYVIDAPQNEFMVYDIKNGTIKIKKGVDRSKVKPRVTALSDLSTRYSYNISSEGFLKVPEDFKEAAKNTPLNQKNVVDSYLLGIEGLSAFEDVQEQIEKDGITAEDIIANPDKVVDALKESYSANTHRAPFVIKRDLKKIEGLRVRGKLSNTTSVVNTEGDFIGDSTEYQYDSMFKGIEKDPSTYNIIKQKLKELYPEIKLKEVQTVIDGFGREVLGKALGSIIEVSSKGKLDTVPHEYAHVYINVLETTDFMDKLLKQVEKETGLDRTDAKEYLARHMGENFTKQIKKSKLSIKLGHLINRAKHKIISAMIALSYTLAIKVYGEEAGSNKVKAILGAYYKRQKKKVVPLKTNIKKASIRFYTGANKDAIRFTPKTGYTKVSMEETLKNEPMAVTILGRVLDTFKTATLTGSIALAEQGDVFRHGISSLHDMDVRVHSSEFNNIEESVLDISPNAVLIYDIPTKTGRTIKSFIIPPDGRKIVDIKRDIRRVVSYKIIDVDTGKVVGVYKAAVDSRKQIISEKTRGESAIMLDLMESDKTADSINFFSTVMQRNIPLALAKSIFKAKQEIITGGMARDKDIIDYTLFAQDPITEVTDPELFVEKDNTEETSTQQEDTTDSNILKSIAREVTGKVKHIYTTHKLREKLQSVFDMLGEVTDDLMYMSEADKDTQVGHLARVMTDIIGKAGHDLDRASVTINEVTFKTDGNIDTNTNAVNVNVNTTSPLTYAGQSAQEVYVHELIHAVTRSALLGNSNFQHEIRKLRREVKDTFELKARPYEVFLNTDENGNVIYLTDKASEIADAKEQYNYVFKDGKNSAEPHAVLDEFLAYALTNKFLVKELSKMPSKQSPLWSTNPKDTPVEKIVKLLANLVNRLTTILNRKDRPKNIEEQIFALTYDVVAISEKRKSYLQVALTKLKIGEHFYRSNKIVSDFFKTIVKEGVEVGGKRYIAMVDKITKDGKVNSFIANLLYDTKLAAMYVAYGSFIEKHPRLQFHLGDKYRKFSPSIVKNMFSLKSDFFGNKDNVFTRLTFESNAKIDQTRKAYKNSIISNLLDSFKTEGLLTKENKEAITRGLFKTSFSDLIALKAFSLQDALAFFSDDKALSTEIAKYAGLLGMPSNQHYTTQTHALVDFMLTGNNDNINQFKNPELIYIKDPSRNSNDKVDQIVVDNLKIYVTLLAIQGTTDTTKKAVADIAKQEFAADTLDNGIINVVNMHTAFKHRSLVEGFDNTAAQMTQGYIATVVDSGISFEFAPTDKETISRLRTDGFTLISKLKPIAGLQTTAYGIYIRKNDPDLPRVKGSLSVTANHSSGMSLMEIIRRDVKPVFVQEVFQNFMAEQKKYMNSSNHENTMMPIIDAWGNITDYSIHMKHNMVEKHLNQNLQFDEVLATMFSNLEDKLASKDMNIKVITELHKYSKKHYKDNPKRFINILGSKNRDEYFNVLPAHTRYEITRRATYDKKTKSKQFFVDMSLLDEVFGYQLPSVSTLSVFKKHPVAERRAKVFEKVVREVVAFVKETIIIRIPIVPAVNIISNYVSSFLHGVPIGYINKTWSEGVRELHMYQNDAESLRLIDLKILGNPTHNQVAQLERKRAKLIFRMNNNKVAKFMDMGLFNSITEDINQNEFTYRRKLQGKISNSKVLSKFKGAPSEVVNQLYMGEKTSTFKFLMHLTQISDFVARYTLYKYDTEVLKLDEETAYKSMVDMFVSYDRPLNKYIQYGNDHGFLFFIKYWIRIQRPALKLVKDKPVNVALLLLGNQMIGIESIFNSSVLTGNLFPMVGDVEMFANELVIPSGLEIMSGASL